MAYDRKEYRKNSRIICYPGADTKSRLKQAVEKGLSPSLSKLSSDIIEQNYDKHIKQLEKSSDQP